MIFNPNGVKRDGLMRMIIPSMCKVLFPLPRTSSYYQVSTATANHTKHAAVPWTYDALSCLHVSSQASWPPEILFSIGLSSRFLLPSYFNSGAEILANFALQFSAHYHQSLQGLSIISIILYYKYYFSSTFPISTLILFLDTNWNMFDIDLWKFKACSVLCVCLLHL